MIHRQTTKELLAKSLKELSQSKPTDKIAIKEITQNCGLTPTTFYNHFHDKYDLIIWIYSTMVEETMNKINNTDYEWKDTLLDGIKYSVENRQFIINAIMHTSGQNSFIYHVSKIDIKALSNYIMKSNNLESLPMDVEAWIKIYCFGIVQLSCEWLINKMPIPIDEFVTLLEEGLPSPLKKYLYKYDIT